MVGSYSIIFITVTSLTTLIRETSILNQSYQLSHNSPLFSLYKLLKINIGTIFIPIMLALHLMPSGTDYAQRYAVIIGCMVPNISWGFKSIRLVENVEFKKLLCELDPPYHC